MAEMLYALTSLVILHGAGTAVDDHTEVWCLRIDQTQLRGSGVDIKRIILLVYSFFTLA